MEIFLYFKEPSANFHFLRILSNHSPMQAGSPKCAATCAAAHATGVQKPAPLPSPVDQTLASLQGQRRIPAAALFVYVPAPDHACCGNATRAPLLEPRGHLQAPVMLTHGDLARGKGTCVLSWATAAYANWRG